MTKSFKEWLNEQDEDKHEDGSEHEWHEGVDENGELAEPPYDVCIHCGKTRH